MKKTILCVFMVCCMLLSAVMPAFASDSLINDETTTTVICLDDGYYIVTKITSNPVISRSSTFTKTGSKVVTVYSGDDEVLCEYTLYGEFQVVSGVSAVCTSATYTQNIYAGGWTFSGGQATKSGATAYGVGKFTKKILFITTKEVDIDISFTCDVYGNITSE